MSVHGDYQRRAAQWHDLRPCDARPCPRVAAGRRCIAGNNPQRRCICERHGHPLFDHRRIWLDQAGRHVFTIEPYNAAGDDLAALLEDLHALGLDVDLTGRSPWNPGCTFLILARKAGNP